MPDQVLASDSLAPEQVLASINSAGGENLFSSINSAGGENLFSSINSAGGENLFSSLRQLGEEHTMPTVLIIEDDPNVRKFITVNLSRRGYRAITATSGEDGLAQVRAEQPDLILLDLKLPGVDGWATLETLRAESDLAGIPVIIITASAVKEEEKRARQSGAVDYLVKPVGVRQLLAAVRAVLGEEE